jgi:hypothetical protein
MAVISMGSPAFSLACMIQSLQLRLACASTVHGARTTCSVRTTQVRRRHGEGGQCGVLCADRGHSTVAQLSPSRPQLAEPDGKWMTLGCRHLGWRLRLCLGGAELGVQICQFVRMTFREQCRYSQGVGLRDLAVAGGHYDRRCQLIQCLACFGRETHPNGPWSGQSAHPQC